MPQFPERIAFMHIPKTAGVSVVNAFTDRLGGEACTSFSPTITDHDFLGKRFVSGHVYIGDITKDAFAFTFLRDPVKQLASHLLWIDHYNMPEYERETDSFPPSVVEGIKALDGKDLSSARDLDRYLATAPATSILRIRNLQSELMSFCRGEVASVSDKKLAEMAICNTRLFGFIGLSETLSDDMARLFEILGLGDPPEMKQLNAAPSRKSIDIAVPAIRSVLERYVQADLRLYDSVLKLRSRRSWRQRLPTLRRRVW